MPCPKVGAPTGSTPMVTGPDIAGSTARCALTRTTLADGSTYSAAPLTEPLIDTASG
ncbi:hypothetical protein [Mycolicibacterium fallax]|uniref:hypothetical protein n=1 Tax=Mycolicibacterium fallax TaxID=1793 RepID=UPI0021F27E39|nr:hypothetical protein [Mycolicibacterium fallax]